MDTGEITRAVFMGFSSAEKALFYLLAAAATALLAWGIYSRIKKYRSGRRSSTSSQPLQWVQAARAIFTNSGIIKDDAFAGITHLFTFWGFLILFAGTAVIFFNFDVLHLLKREWDIFHGAFYLWLSFLLEIFGLALLAGLSLVILRRWLAPPARLDYSRADNDSQCDRTGYVIGDRIFLGLLFLTVLSGFLVEGLRLAITRPAFASWSFAGAAVARLIAGWHPGVAVFKAAWWIHAGLALSFVAYLPFSKAYHFVAGPLSVLFNAGQEPGAVPPFDENEMDFDNAGHIEPANLTCPELIELDACVRCGRCHAVCPAVASGMPLSPRDVILDMREFMNAFAGISTLWDSQSPSAIKRAGERGLLIGEVIHDDVLWSCTTCLACTEACPVSVMHVPLMVKMRRHLMETGTIDEGLQEALIAISEQGNSFGESPAKRGGWTEDLPFAVEDARKSPVDLLWFVGDYASFDPRAQEATRALAMVLKRFEISFGIMFDSERNSGNDVRRAGEEALFEELRTANIDAIKSCRAKLIITSDPHSFNALKNEYPDLQMPVLHYSQYLASLIREGRLSALGQLSGKATYHDPCYLGRYNGVFDEPRQIIRALGIELVEMPRSREKSFCCGAGGGRIWMREEDPGIRPGSIRIEEALATGVDLIIVCCPKCLVMLEDALKSAGSPAGIRVVDLAELVNEAAGKSEQEPDISGRKS